MLTHFSIYGNEAFNVTGPLSANQIPEPDKLLLEPVALICLLQTTGEYLHHFLVSCSRSNCTHIFANNLLMDEMKRGITRWYFTNKQDFI